MSNSKKLLEYSDYLTNWIRKEVKKAGHKGVVVGVSGGVDSAVVASLAKQAFPNDSLALIMPIAKMGKDFDDAQEVVKKMKIQSQVIDLTNAFKEIEAQTNVKNKMAIANIKPRLRMVTLYAFAQENKYLVLGTDNAAEWLLGYYTKHGDGAADLLPIAHLTKGEVKTLAKALNLPAIVYQKPPSAGLWENQTDEAELNLSYDEVDAYLDGKKVSTEVVKRINYYETISSHKKKGALIPQKFKDIKDR